MRRLLNRRFVPFYFDMFPGFAADADARAAIGKQRPELLKGQIGVNPIFLLTPDGAIVDELSAREATHEGLVAKLLAVLRAHPEQAKPSAAEEAIADPVERAEVLIDLFRDDEAESLLANVDSPRAHYLRGRLAAWRSDYEAMRVQFGKLAGNAEFADDVRVESAWALWAARDFEALAKHLAEFPKGSRRYTEARYLEGLAHFHAGRKKEARALWRTTIKESAQDPWIYRMDWAWADTAASFGARSPLGRIGYMGAYRNPEVFLRETR